MSRGNPHPKHKYTSFNSEPMSERPIAVRLPIRLEDYVRSLPDRTEWLRKAIARQVEEDLKNAG